MYLALKHLHITFAIVSLLLFITRGLWLFTRSSLMTKKWAKVLPHLVSVLLIASGVAVAVHLGLSPGQQPWLVAKIIALLVYIALGIATFKIRNAVASKICWLSALVVFAYMVSVAISKHPLGFLV